MIALKLQLHKRLADTVQLSLGVIVVGNSLGTEWRESAEAKLMAGTQHYLLCINHRPPRSLNRPLFLHVG